MRRLRGTILWAGVVGLAVLAGPAAGSEESALSWKKQASDTRAAVVGVAEELAALGDHGNADAAGLIADATHWLAEGDKQVAEADAKMAAQDYAGASSQYNMAWQYYVKAATAGLNARRMLTGK